MSVEAEGLEDWIGAEVLDPAGEKLGKVAEVFYGDGEPLVVEIRSGIAGRKHHLAALRGAGLSPWRPQEPSPAIAAVAHL